MEEEDAKTQSLCRSAPLETFSERHFPSLSITKIYISEDFLFSRGDSELPDTGGGIAFFFFLMREWTDSPKGRGWPISLFLRRGGGEKD